MPGKYYDPCSFSNPDLFQIDHASIYWTVDFESKTFKGHVKFQMKLNPDRQVITSDAIILDTRDLKIHKVSEEVTKTELEFQLGEYSKNFGTALKISLKNLEKVSERDSLVLVVEYETSPNASALQWLGAMATCGKELPYLFSQCQAIHARSIMPCQDTCYVKFTYDAVVNVQSPLVAVMSAVQAGSKDLGDRIEYSFVQKIRIPSYLLAIVVGALVSKRIGPRSHVWTEKEQIDKAAYEFAEVEVMLKDAEELLGEYVWGTYDLLVLPPTFPYGGMENPNLTFVTPTLLAGDRSLASVVQHEITHSWTGNLVTNKNWEHFWLNEGFTRFIEQKLVGIFNKSEQCRQFECIEGWRHLIEDVKSFGETSVLTQLVTVLKDTDPDDAFSSIPYEKGQTMLFYLEELLGGPEVFNKYLKAHIAHFKGLSFDSDEWKDYLYEYFKDQKAILDQIDWNTWLHKPGMPPYTPKFDQTLANQVIKLSEKLYNEDVTGQDPSFAAFSSSQKRELLGQLLDKDPLSQYKMVALDSYYKFGSTQNAEILFKWLRLGIKAKWQPIIEPALKFMRDQGRMKFTRPVYKDLFTWDDSRDLAIKNFQAQRPYMHQTTASLVEKDLEAILAARSK